MLHPWVTFGIMPAFALANAGVSLDGFAFDAHSTRIATGVALGLVLGKPLGILVASALAVRVGVARIPVGLGWRHLAVMGVLAGIGFTMSLFITRLAFTSESHLAAARLGVLVASVAATLLGLLLGRLLLKPHEPTATASAA